MVDGAIQSSETAPLAGRGAIVATSGMAFGGGLAQGLRRNGARVVEVGTPFDSRASAQAALADAAREVGGADLIVHAGAMPAALVPRALAAMSASDWHEAVHRSMLASLFCLQGAHRLQREAGGAIVFLGPSVALVGAGGLVPLITLAEAQRTLTKSAARQWGRHGIRLNWVGVVASVYAPALAAAALPQTPELGPPPPALGRVPEPQVDVADVIAWLAGDGVARHHRRKFQPRRRRLDGAVSRRAVLKANSTVRNTEVS